MAQVFLTYEQQIEKLIYEKNLMVQNREYAVEELKEIGYFALIGGYKGLFKNPTTKNFKDGTRFEDVLALYKFDENLRELFLKYLLKVERHLRSLISYYFCEKYGENQSFYLDERNFSIYPKYKSDVQRLIGELDKLANKNSDYAYLNHHRNLYQNVPLWVLFHGTTFGTLSKFYMLMTQDLQFKVSKEFYGLSEKQLGQSLNVLTKFRNVCAHNERLFSYKTRNDIPNLQAHKFLKLPKKGHNYAVGTHDLFAVVIILKYMLSAADFCKLKNRIVRVIDTYLDQTHALSKKDIMYAMEFPENWLML